ncbi:unnamed protein product, partial [Allacma fusca]
NHFNKDFLTGDCVGYENITTSFKTLMDCYDIYLEVAGTYALINVPSAAIALGQVLHQFVTGGGIPLLSHSIGCVMWIYSIANIGEILQVQLKEGKDQIRNVLFFDKAVPPNENFRELAYWIMDWNWIFTARNIFVVQRSLILGVL